uniref:Ig-like domain-containing protein n=1 Tax=Chrysemys picta bellii TaxID=8478 RepID=A0A8C3FNG8_CHRPI
PGPLPHSPSLRQHITLTTGLSLWSPPAASVLGSCLQPAPAQTPTPVTIVLTPPSPVVGGGVSLAPQPPPQDLLTCNWYRSATVTDPNSLILIYVQYPNPVQNNGPAHTGRETAGPGCALNIAGLTLSDTGSYTVQIQSSTAATPVRSTVVLHGPNSAQIDPPGPIALTLGLLLNLTCIADSVPAPSYRWVLNGTDSKETGSSLTFNPTTWAQQGTYECWTHNPVTGRTAWASVAVRVTGTGESPGWSNTLQTQGSQVWHQRPSAVLGGAGLQGAGWGDCG